jgi:biotin carboxyl carrier protein
VKHLLLLPRAISVQGKSISVGKEGDIVQKGATICIIEAMKLMNEIEATTSGRVVKIQGVEGQVVEFGESLFLIDPAV